jgi:hypothetical protein
METMDRQVSLFFFSYSLISSSHAIIALIVFSNPCIFERRGAARARPLCLTQRRNRSKVPAMIEPYGTTSSTTSARP